METTMENGLYMAVPLYVLLILHLLLSGWTDAVCVYAADQGG